MHLRLDGRVHYRKEAHVKVSRNLVGWTVKASSNSRSM